MTTKPPPPVKLPKDYTQSTDPGTNILKRTAVAEALVKRATKPVFP